MTTEHLMDKINHLTGQVKNDEMQIFVHELAVQDAEAPVGSDDVDKQLKATADSAKQAMKLLQRRIEVRKTLLRVLQEELDAAK